MSVLAVGSVLLLCANLLIGGENIWALTAIGIWALLLLVHVILVVIARLSLQLLEDEDEEEVVLLPVKDAVIVSAPHSTSKSSPDPASTWAAASPPATPAHANPAPPEGESVSWDIATNAARLQRPDSDPPREPNR